MSNETLHNLKKALSIIIVLLFISITLMCFPRSWGGHHVGAAYPNGQWRTVNFFDADAWLFGVVVIVCCILGVVFVVTKLHKLLLGVSIIQSLLIIISYVEFESRGSVYELGLMHLIASIAATAASIYLLRLSINQNTSK